MNTGELIRTYRKKLKMTQEQLAHKCGTSAAMIRQYELGKRNPKIQTILKLSEALGVSYKTLAPNTIIIDDTPANYEINTILKKVENGEVLTPEEATQLRIHVQNGIQQAKMSLKELSDSTSKSIADSIPLALKAGQDVLESSLEIRLLYYYRLLSAKGQTEAIKRMEELTHLPAYTNNSDEPPTTE